MSKKVIYLDQFAVSEIYKVKSGTRRADANSRDFWEEATRLIDRVLLLQQAIFPDSSIHWDETIVSRFPSELRLAHDMLGGDVTFRDAEAIIAEHEWHFFEAFLSGHPPPALTFDLDDVIEGERNAWLRDMHIGTNMDMSQFADAVRVSRDQSGSALAQLAQTWAHEKASFDKVLARELGSYGRAHADALMFAVNRMAEGVAAGDLMSVLDASHHNVYRQFIRMTRHLEGTGSSIDDARATAMQFWNWQGNRDNPNHRISAYLFAAAARKMAAGQKKAPSRGFFNDVTAISVYAPYVDAMLIDNEAAGFLGEEPLRSTIRLRTH